MDKLALETDINDGLSSYQLAEKYGKGQSTITYWLRKFGLKTKFNKIGNGYIPPNLFQHNKHGSIYETIDWNECQRLYDTGKSWEELTECGFPHNAIEWARKNGKLNFRSMSESAKLAWKNGKQDAKIYQTAEHRKKMSKFGGLKPTAGRCKHIKYTMRNGTVVDLQGSWELKFVEFLDSQKIQWERNRIGYRYMFDGKKHEYFPDFRIPKFDVYIEVKGYETDKDRAKWKQFPFKLLIVKKQEIQDLTTWWNNLHLSCNHNGTASEAVRDANQKQ